MQYRKWLGNRPICVELGLQAASWDVGQHEAPRGLFQMGQERKHGHSRPWQREKASAVLAGPQTGVQLCPACPRTCWEESRTRFSLPTPLAAQLSHASLSGAVRGHNGMTEFPGHSGPSWARSPQGQPHHGSHALPCSPGGRALASSGNRGRVVKSLTSPPVPYPCISLGRKILLGEKRRNR